MELDISTYGCGESLLNIHFACFPNFQVRNIIVTGQRLSLYIYYILTLGCLKVGC